MSNEEFAETPDRLSQDPRSLYLSAKRPDARVAGNGGCRHRDTARIEIDTDGKIIVVTGKPKEQIDEGGGNEWDKI